MPHDFQQYTTYEQSVELKGLGAPQGISLGDCYWYANQLDKSDLELRVFYSVYPKERRSIERDPTNHARAFTLQQMLHELMAVYFVSIETTPTFDSCDDQCMCRLGVVDVTCVTLQRRDWEYAANADVANEDGCSDTPPVAFSFVAYGRKDVPGDPFPAVYECYKWYLQQQRTSTTDITNGA